MPANPRVRGNNVQGTVSDNPLTAGATTLNSAGLANLPAVATQHAVIVLDPLRSAGAPEIVVVTAHTGAATSATVTRGAYGTTARSHASGTLWVHAPITEDFLAIVTSGTRPSDPYRGQLIFETDTDKVYGWSIADAWQQVVDLGAWDAYTPTNTNVTLGNGTQTALWTRMGRLVVVRYHLLWGSTTAFGGTVELGLPVAAVSSITQAGPANLIDAGTRFYLGQVLPGRDAAGTNANKALVVHSESGNNGRVDATNPFTWTTNDLLVATFAYEAAA